MPPSNLFTKLTEVSLDDAQPPAEPVLDVLVKAFDLVGVSLYLSTPDANALLLRSQVGFAYEDYKSFELTLDSLPGRAMVEQRTIVEDDPTTSRLFRNKEILARKSVAAIVAAPLLLSDQQLPESPVYANVPTLIGALAFYPRDRKDVNSVLGWMNSYGAFLGRLYVAILERQAMAFRRQTVDRVAYRSDIGSLAHSFLTLVKEELSVEAASLWTVDAHRNVLYLRRSTELAVAHRERDVSTIPLSEPGVIPECFKSRTPLIHTRRHKILDPTDIHEKLRRPLSNAAIIPVLLPEKARLRGRSFPSAGVLVLMNHAKRVGTIDRLTPFSWEDSFLAEFACEVISVLIYQMLRTQDHESDFERLMHGARTSLQAARSNLQLLERTYTEPHLELDSRNRNLVPNAIDWLEDLESQINRDELTALSELEVRPISLYGEVLAKLKPMAWRMRTRARNPSFALTGFDELSQTYRNLPRVQGNRQALDCVFRNLLDNSMKYCQTDTDVHATVAIDASVSPNRKTVAIAVSDNGIGIPAHERDLIFENGYRGGRASARQPQGVGRGLYESRLLLERMGGSLELKDSEKGAEFVVTLRTTQNRQDR